jgi:hypothetical protein
MRRPRSWWLRKKRIHRRVAESAEKCEGEANMSRWRLDAGQIEVVDERVAEILRKKTPAERLAIAFEANRTARRLMAGGLRSQHPDWSDEAIKREIARRMSGGAV